MGTLFYENNNNNMQNWSPTIMRSDDKFRQTEKDHKLIQLLESQQARGRSKAGLNGVMPPSKYASPIPSPTPSSTSIGLGPGKVRQMFQERRNNKGIDKSYPLEPLQSPSPRSSPGQSPTSYNNMSSSSSSVGSGLANLGSSRKTPSPAPPPPKTTSSSNKPLSSPIKKKSPPFKPTNPPPALERNLTYVKAKMKTPTPPPVNDDEYDDEETSNNSNSRPNSLDSHASSGLEIHGIRSTPIPRGTKYTDYAEEFESTVRKKEAELKGKLNLLTNVEKKQARPTTLEMSYKPPFQKPTAPKKAPPSKVKAASTPMAATGGTSSPIRSKTPPPGTVPCSNCGRCFAPERIDKHESICYKTKDKKRKVFDPNQALKEEISAQIEPKPAAVAAPRKGKQQPPPKGKVAGAAAGGAGGKSNWRKKHEDFIQTIRLAKEYNAHIAAGGDPNDLPPPPSSDYSDYVECPYCGRKFSAGAADRHIPMCASIKSNKR